MADDQQQSGRSPEERPGQSPSPAPSGPEAESPAPSADGALAASEPGANAPQWEAYRRPAPAPASVSQSTQIGQPVPGGQPGPQPAPAGPRRGSALPIALAFVAIAVLVAASVVAYAAAQPGSNIASRPTASPSARATPSAVDMTPGSPVAGRTTVRWFVGLGSGTDNYQIDAQKAFVANYNATNSDGISIQLEIVPNNTAYTVLKTEIAAGNAPDIVGPVGVQGRNGFEGQFLDLTDEIHKNGVDLTAYDPALVRSLQEGSDGQIGLPYDIFPGYIWYNKDIFTKAGLSDLPTAIGEQYEGQPWTWQALGKIAAQLTLDENGYNSANPDFDKNEIVQYGMDFQWADARRIVSCFGGGSFVASDGKTAQIPPVWADAFNWYYTAIWGGHYVPNGAAEASALLDNGYSIGSGRVAMSAGWAWGISSIASSASTTQVKSWDIAVMPSWDGTTTSPVDIDTFTITKASRNPDAAFKAMMAIMADPTLMRNYGGEPAKTADQAAYFAAYDSALAPIFPGNHVTWSVLGEMAKVPAVPNSESDMPAFTQAGTDIATFLNKLQNTSGLNVNTELAKLQQTLQKDFDAASP